MNNERDESRRIRMYVSMRPITIHIYIIYKQKPIESLRQLLSVELRDSKRVTSKEFTVASVKVEQNSILDIFHHLSHPNKHHISLPNTTN